MEQFDRDFAFFELALDEPAGSRDSFVASYAESDEQRESVRRLLRLTERDSFLDHTVADAFPRLLLPTGFDDIGIEIIREVGRGGMGVVYLARDTSLDRFVALKVIRCDGPTQERNAGRLLREARAIAKLDHPGIAPVYQAGTLDGAVYIVTEFIEGETLARAIARRVEEGLGAPSWHWRAARVVSILAQAVDHAHRQGVLHRDIKPSNVLIDEHGDPHLIDFGVAKIADMPTETREGDRPGSLGYMSPEQLGVVQAEVGEGADIYALGLLLFECLAGRRLREGTDYARIAARIDREPGTTLRKLQPSVPRSLALVCDRTLQLHPTDRYARAGDMARELEAAASGELPVARLSLAPLRRAWRTRRVPVLVAIAVVVASGVTAAVTTLRIPRRTVVRVTSASATAPHVPVRVREIDLYTRAPGEWRSLGQTPAVRRMPQGLYRFEVGEPGYGREFTRELAGDEAVEIVVAPLQPGGNATQMAFVPGGEYVVGAPMAPAAMGTRTVRIDPFWIDCHEVTNSQYRRFIQATNRTPPQIWPREYDESWDELPVTGVSLEDARAYAEWVGKRLPTDVEWECAAAGPTGRKFPWGDEYDESVDAEFDAASGTHAWSRRIATEEVRAGYLNGSRIVARSPLDRTHTGVCDTFGNVAEWTESVTEVSLPGEGTLVQAIIKGWWWGDATPERRSLQGYLLASADARRANVGFRCVRSAPLGE